MSKAAGMSREVAALLHDLTDSPAVKRLLELSLGRVMDNIVARQGGLGDACTHEQARHIADWLHASVINGESWIDNLDSEGRPKKVMKFGNVEQIVAEADKAMLRSARKAGGIQLRDGDEELFMELGDGHYCVRLLTAAALDRESAEMQHCIGNGSYDNGLAEAGTVYLSIRDASGKAHVTLEVVDGELIQMQGKQNRSPLERYVRLLPPLFARERYAVNTSKKNSEWHFADGYMPVRVDGLRETTEIMGNLRLEGMKLALPERLKVNGDLWLTRCSFSSFPAAVEATGAIHILSCGQLPDDCEFTAGGDVSFESTVVDKIASCRAGGDVSFEGTELLALPQTLVFNGSLNLCRSQITSIDAMASVAGSLDISKTAISAVPDGLEVGKDFLAASSKLSEYPVALRCGGSVDISGTGIKSLPEGLCVSGDLDISGLSIETMPSVMTASQLIARNASIWNMSPAMRIKRHMIFDGGRVRLPAGLTVHGILSLKGTDIEKLPDDLAAIRIEAEGSSLARIGTGLKVMGSAVFDKTRLETLPVGMEIWDKISVRESYMRSLPEGFSCDADLDLTGSEIETLPEGMRIGGSLVLHNTAIETLPSNLHVGKDLVITETKVTAIPETVSIVRAVVAGASPLSTGKRSYNRMKRDEAAGIQSGPRWS
jgi:hypothetical protein